MHNLNSVLSASVKMKPVATLAVLAAVLLIVHANFYIDLFDPTTKKYLSSIDYVSDGRYMVAAKNNPDIYSRFKLMVSGLHNNKITLHHDYLNDYFCHIQRGNSSVDASMQHHQTSQSYTIDDSLKFEYKLKLNPDNICGARIALKADNGRYWMVSPQDGINYVKPLATSPVYFNMSTPNK